MMMTTRSSISVKPRSSRATRCRMRDVMPVCILPKTGGNPDIDGTIRCGQPRSGDRTTEGAVSRAVRSSRSGFDYGPVQAVVVMSPPGPRLYQLFVPTVDERQYEVVLGVPMMLMFLTPWSYAVSFASVMP